MEIKLKKGEAIKVFGYNNKEPVVAIVALPGGKFSIVVDPGQACVECSGPELEVVKSHPRREGLLEERRKSLSDLVRSTETEQDPNDCFR